MMIGYHRKKGDYTPKTYETTFKVTGPKKSLQPSCCEKTAQVATKAGLGVGAVAVLSCVVPVTWAIPITVGAGVAGYFGYRKVQNIVGRAILPATSMFKSQKKDLDDYKNEWAQSEKTTKKYSCTSVEIKMEDNVVLDALVVGPRKKSLNPDLWTIRFEMNGATYQQRLVQEKNNNQILPFNYIDYLGATNLFFSYRGVGNSTGTPTKEGLMKDVRAAVQYAISQGATKIVIDSESVGGAISLVGMENYFKENGKEDIQFVFVNTRSFSNTTHFLLGTATIIKTLGWELNAEKAAKSLKDHHQIIVYTDQDNVIPARARLYKKLEKITNRVFIQLEIPDNVKNTHTFTPTLSDQIKILKELKKALDLKTKRTHRHFFET